MNGYSNFRPGASRSRGFGPAAPRPAENHLESFQREFQVLSRRCIQELFAFLLIATGCFALRHADLLGALPDPVRTLLGAPPPPVLTSLLLGIYLFSQTVLTLGRAVGGARPLLKWQHLAYRCAFFFFYATAGALGDHFLAVLVAGLTLFGLEFFSLWTYSARNLPPGRALSGRL